MQESVPGAQSPVPRDRIPQPHPDSGQGRSLAIDRCGTRTRAIYEAISRVRVSWRLT